MEVLDLLQEIGVAVLCVLLVHLVGHHPNSQELLLEAILGDFFQLRLVHMVSQHCSILIDSFEQPLLSVFKTILPIFVHFVFNVPQQRQFVFEPLFAILSGLNLQQTMSFLHYLRKTVAKVLGDLFESGSRMLTVLKLIQCSLKMGQFNPDLLLQQFQMRQPRILLLQVHVDRNYLRDVLIDLSNQGFAGDIHNRFEFAVIKQGETSELIIFQMNRRKK